MYDDGERTVLRPEPYRPEVELLKATLDWQLARGLATEDEVRTELPEIVSPRGVEPAMIEHAPRARLVAFLFGPVRIGRACRLPRSEMERAFVAFIVERAHALGLLCDEDLAQGDMLDHLLRVLPRVELERLARERLQGVADASIVISLVGAHASLEAVDRCLIQRCVAPQLLAERASDPGLAQLIANATEVEVDDSPTANRPPDALGPDLAWPESGRSTVPPESFVRGAEPALETLPPSAPQDVLDRDSLVQTLAAVGRLPPHHEVLDVEMLRSLVALYERLNAAVSLVGRLNAFQEVFPAERDRRTALIAWARVLLDDARAASVSFEDIDQLTSTVERAERTARGRPTASAATRFTGS